MPELGWSFLDQTNLTKLAKILLLTTKQRGKETKKREEKKRKSQIHGSVKCS